MTSWSRWAYSRAAGSLSKCLTVRLAFARTFDPLSLLVLEHRDPLLPLPISRAEVGPGKRPGNHQLLVQLTNSHLLLRECVSKTDILLLEDVLPARADDPNGLELLVDGLIKGGKVLLQPAEPGLGIFLGLADLVEVLIRGQLLELLEQGLEQLLGPRGSLPSSMTMNMFVLLTWRTWSPPRISSCAGSSKAATSDAMVGLLTTLSASPLL